MKTTLRRGTWNTYRITGYTYQAGTDARATGGVHLHEVRRGRAGWQKRVVDSNGNYSSAGEAEPISDAEGEAAFQTACER
jgi:alkylated DNA nucleotide flippase Atl1